MEERQRKSNLEERKEHFLSFLSGPESFARGSDLDDRGVFGAVSRIRQSLIELSALARVTAEIDDRIRQISKPLKEREL